MTNSSEMGRFSSLRAEKSSTFSQTCSLLSQYLKEKKTAVTTFGDLALAINTNTNSDAHGMTTTMDLFPQQSGFESMNRHDTGGEGAQMTIFYNGQVIVLNDFPADKAKQLMALAAKETALPKPTTSSSANRNPTALPSCPSPGLVLPRPKPVTAIPIARKASLTRFLEKRKDRITTRAPYPVCNSSNAKACPPPQKAGETTKALSWLGLGAQYPSVQYGHHRC